MFLDEPSKNTIVSIPDVVSVASSRLFGARDGTIEPDVKAVAESEEGELAAPFNPVGLAEIKDQVGGPVSTV